VFQGLSVFRGGFTRQAAQYVGEASLRHLASLVSKSLLSRDEEGRYQIHRLLQRYAADKLEEKPWENETTRDKHCEYYLDYMAQWETKIRSGDHLQAWGEIDNIRAAYDRAIKREMVAEMHQAHMALSWLYDQHSWVEAVKMWEYAARALETDQPEGEKGIVFGQVLSEWGCFLSQLGRSKEGIPILRKSQAVLRQLDAQAELAWTNNLLGFSTNDPMEAKQCLQESLDYYREAGVDWGIALALSNLGYLEVAKGAFRSAESYFKKAIEINQKLDDRRAMALTLFGLGDSSYQNGEYRKAKKYFRDCYSYSEAIENHQFLRNASTRLGDLALLTGEYEEAQKFIQKALFIAKDNGNQGEIAWSTLTLGSLAFNIADYENAIVYYNQALADFKNTRNSVGLSIVYGGLGNVSLALGDDRDAQHYLRQSLEKAMEIQKDWLYLSFLSHSLALIQASGKLERSVEIAALITHHPLSDSGEIAAMVTNRIQSSVFACAQAQKLLDRTKNQLSPIAYTKALERGKALEVEPTAKGFLGELDASY
jgi:tetratricopeptide (TPR) repeat protein